MHKIGHIRVVYFEFLNIKTLQKTIYNNVYITDLIIKNSRGNLKSDGVI